MFSKYTEKIQNIYFNKKLSNDLWIGLSRDLLSIIIIMTEV
jgi:hypothetical protein